MTAQLDLLVIGAGPAGLGLGCYAAREGLRVLVVDANPKVEWHCTYCTWLLELDSSWIQGLQRPGGAEVFDLRYDSTVMIGPDGERIQLGRGYGRLNSSAIRSSMISALKAGQGELVEGVVSQVEHGEGYTQVKTTQGQTRRAKCVVDASGHYTSQLDLCAGPHRRWQCFVGETLRCRQPHGYDLGTAVIFDWRLAHEGEDGVPPTFAYVLPMDEYTLMVEETVLMADEKVPLDAIQARLEGRKKLMGLEGAEVVGEPERCSFPMGGAVPVRTQQLVGFGAAARMVHPATGYSVAFTLNSVPEVVARLKLGLSCGLAGLPLARSVWECIWSDDRLRQYTIYTMGADVIMSLNRKGLGQFFTAFFKTPMSHWTSFLDRTNTGREQVMTGVAMWLKASLTIKLRLMWGGIVRGGLKVATAAIASVALSHKRPAAVASSAKHE
eukprot:CAMPEP_0204311066 /NCGR_PEP_ID=MMETSP0469-20131031/2111_1 /ASSEMBLY_ACC=CAM_ASM_000384 /TAXON_ID=2969 /ORGANISM="Oxyrrhis marina" /LENGTH=439 /DNA_ID=CAMNT_0051290951 /DNA_START=54 /DNA_END=1373 /DNA_ORIENTATION=-